MKLGILSRNPDLYSTRRLVQAARLRGHQVMVMDTMSIALEMGLPHSPVKIVSADASPRTFGTYTNAIARVPDVEAIIPRIGASITEYGVAVVRHFETQGIFCTATSQAIAQSRDKLHSLQLMSQAGLPIPKTAVIAQPSAFFTAIEAVGGPPVIIKLVQGTQGKGVILAPNLQTAAYVLNKLRGMKRQALVQEFIAEARGRDIRIIVVGDQCVAAMERRASAGDFRSNLHLGGTAVPVTPTQELQQLARAAARAHGLHVAGVDILQSQRGPLLLEVNSSPGLEGIEETTNVDIATAIINFVEQHVSRKKRKRPPKRKQHK
ncbi:MAG: RimK family alpha-L-glutamate ligase [Ardenticatenaceae bacterium]|nr:RimK family alpha-L-glutamate ligase [Ardenticatenaceae bacterium]